MSDRGIAHMGVGRAAGDNRVEEAVKNAIESPLLETSIDGAKAIILNIMGGYDMGMLEVSQAAAQIEDAAGEDAIVIFGASIKEELQDEILVTVIATGFEQRPSEAASGLLRPANQTSDQDTAEAAAAETQNKEDDLLSGGDTDFVIPSFLNRERNGF
jgi:cell division protein FtsZ